MRIAALLLGVALIAGCGADGAPEPPTMHTTIGIGTGGAYGATHVTKGPVTITLGTGL